MPNQIPVLWHLPKVFGHPRRVKPSLGRQKQGQTPFSMARQIAILLPDFPQHNGC